MKCLKEDCRHYAGTFESGCFLMDNTVVCEDYDSLKAKKDAGSKVPCSGGLSCAWIDVKERLPEEGQIALWWNEDIRMIEFGSAGSFNGENVPYWMPLPDPPAR